MGFLHRFGVVLLISVVCTNGLMAPATAAAAAGPQSLLGSSINDRDDVARISGLMGRPLSSVRVFYDATPSTWSKSTLLASIPTNGTAVIDFESGTPEAVQAFLSGYPTTLHCYASYWHEPEDEFSTAMSRRRTGLPGISTCRQSARPAASRP